MNALLNALRAPALISALALTGLAGCGPEEEAGPETDARLVFMHQSPVLGSIELLANGEKVVQLDRGQLSQTLAIEAGSTLLEVRNTGADVNVLDASLKLEVQPYLVAVVGDTLEELRFWTVDEPAPEMTDGEAALRVVNLDDGAFTYDVYLDDQQVAAGLAPIEASAFAKVDLSGGAAEPSTSPRTVRLRVFNAGDDPSGRPLSVSPAEIALGNRRAYMLVLQTDAENPDVLSVTAVAP